MVLQTENRQFVRSECVGCFKEPDEHPDSVKKGWRHNTPVRWQKIIWWSSLILQWNWIYVIDENKIQSQGSCTDPTQCSGGEHSFLVSSVMLFISTKVNIVTVIVFVHFNHHDMSDMTVNAILVIVVTRCLCMDPTHDVPRSWGPQPPNVKMFIFVIFSRTSLHWLLCCPCKN